MPLSPVGLQYSGIASEYIGPLFAQRWSLFAPDPPLSDVVLNVQCRIGGDGDASESTWLDTRMGLIEQQQELRLTPAERLRRVERAAVFGALGTRDQVLDEMIEHADNELTDYNAFLATLLTERAERLRREQDYIHRVAASNCFRIFGTTAVAARPRVLLHEIPKYSERNSSRDYSNSRQILFEWREIGPNTPTF